MLLKRVGVWSAAKVSSGLYGALGLMEGTLFTVAELFHHHSHLLLTFPDVLFGVGAIITLPIVAGIIGLLGGALIACLYNLLARFAGGLELELE